MSVIESGAGSVEALAGRRAIGRALVAVVMVAVGVFALWWRPAVSVRTARVTLGDVRLEVAGTASIESEQTILLAATTGGRIESIALLPGDRVRSGDLVAQLDVEDLKLQDRASVAAEGRARALLARSIAELERAASASTLARKALERAEVLHHQGALSSSAIDEARAGRDQQEANRRALVAAVAQARAEVESSKEATGLLRHRIDEGTLTSPVDGIVVRRFREPGDVLGPGQPVLEIAASRKIWASAWIDETALPDLHVGAPARIVLRSATGQELRGIVDRIAPQTDRETHELLVDVELLEVPDSLAFGQRADVFITLREQKNVLQIPRGFCLDSTSCLVDRDGRTAHVPVELGLAGSETIEVDSGLVAGDVVLAPTRGDAKALEGRRWRPRP